MDNSSNLTSLPTEEGQGEKAQTSQESQKLKHRPDLNFWKLWNISFGFFGVQIEIGRAHV